MPCRRAACWETLLAPLTIDGNRVRHVEQIHGLAMKSNPFNKCEDIACRRASTKCPLELDEAHLRELAAPARMGGRGQELHFYTHPFHSTLIRHEGLRRLERLQQQKMRERQCHNGIDPLDRRRDESTLHPKVQHEI